MNPALEPLKNKYSRIKKIEAFNSSGNICFEEINELSGKEFEGLIHQQFIKLGFKSSTPPATGDYGADLIVETVNQSVIIIQCKRYRSKVNLKAVQEVIAAIAHYGGDFGIVVTNNGFLRSAKVLAKHRT